MNSEHDQLCSSQEWAEYIRDDVLPTVLGERSFDGPVLEIGPGFGAATRWLVEFGDDLTAIEIDPGLAADIGSRFPDVRVERGSAAAMPFDDGTFAGAVCFTMLHHVPSPAEQDAVFGEVARVLQQGGWFAGSDSVGSPELAEFHAGDTYNPLDPDTLAARLTAAGLVDVTVELQGPDSRLLVFRGRAPG